MKFARATVFREFDPYKGWMQTRSERWRRALAHLTEGGGPWGNKGGSGGGGDSGGGSGGGPRNPWNLPPGGGRRPSGPQGRSALDALLKKLEEMFGGGFPGGGQSKLIRNLLLGFALLWIVFTSFHRIGAQEQGVIMRLGKYAGRLDPGISMTLPSPFDRVYKVDVQAIDTIDIPEGSGANLILTGDQNIIDIAYSVRWDVRDPENFLFQMVDPKLTIREVAESAMREVLSTVLLTDAMGPGRGLIEQRVATRMQQLLDDYHAGVTIRGVAIKQADPPEEVNDAFKQVTVAQQQRLADINNANGYAQQILSRAQGDATAFNKVFEQYRLAPEVTRRRMYYETMEQVLEGMDKTIVEPGSVAPYLPIGRTRPQVSVGEGGQ